MKVDPVSQVLRIDAPEWYERQDFRDFINGQRAGQNRPPATWHVPGEEPDEYSDVFVTYDMSGCDPRTAEGSDAPPIMPEDIWDHICDAAAQRHVTYGLVWISNVG